MSTAAQQPMNLIRKAVKVANGSQLVKGVGVTLAYNSGVLEATVAGANAKVAAVATESILGDGTKMTEVILLAACGTVKVKCSGAATVGEYAIAGADGFENLTAGGGTVVKHCCGVFLETGVDNDFVEMLPMRMPAVTA